LSATSDNRPACCQTLQVGAGIGPWRPAASLFAHVQRTSTTRPHINQADYFRVARDPGLNVRGETQITCTACRLYVQVAADVKGGAGRDWDSFRVADHPPGTTRRHIGGMGVSRPTGLFSSGLRRPSCRVSKGNEASRGRSPAGQSPPWSLSPKGAI
jgi:hypothetical protein